MLKKILIIINPSSNFFGFSQFYQTTERQKKRSFKLSPIPKITGSTATAEVALILEVNPFEENLVGTRILEFKETPPRI